MERLSDSTVNVIICYVIIVTYDHLMFTSPLAAWSGLCCISCVACLCLSCLPLCPSNSIPWVAKRSYNQNPLVYAILYPVERLPWPIHRFFLMLIESWLRIILLGTRTSKAELCLISYQQQRISSIDPYHDVLVFLFLALCEING